ncbi:MAG: hypothetical protein ACE5HE_00235 [Phycisphaerae bacterium]
MKKKSKGNVEVVADDSLSQRLFRAVVNAKGEDEGIDAVMEIMNGEGGTDPMELMKGVTCALVGLGQALKAEINCRVRTGVMKL